MYPNHQLVMAVKTYEKLLVTAERLMNTYGIHGFTHSQLIREAKVSNSGAINYYFTDRIDLFKHICKYRISIVSKYRAELVNYVDMVDNVTPYHYMALIVVPIVYASYRTKPHSYYSGLLMQYHLSTDNIMWDIMDDSCQVAVKNALEEIQTRIHEHGISSGDETDIGFRMQIVIRMVLSAMGLIEKRVRESEDVQYETVLNELWTVINGLCCGVSKDEKWNRESFISVNVKIAEKLKDVNFNKKVVF